MNLNPIVRIQDEDCGEQYYPLREVEDLDDAQVGALARGEQVRVGGGAGVCFLLTPMRDAEVARLRESGHIRC